MAKENGKPKVINWRSRIVKTGKILASQIAPHPQNPRKHPQLQRDAVAASFDELGQIAPIIMNVNNGYLVDGEERSWLALDQPGDVELDAIWVDLTEDEHVKALLYFDATGDLATYDADLLDSLLREVNSDDASIQMMLSSLAAQVNPLVYGDGERGETPDERLDIFLNATIKQIVLYFANAEYDAVIERLQTVMTALDLENHTEVFLKLLEHYEATAR